MSTFLGRDLSSVFATRFRGRLRSMTLEILAPGTPTMGEVTDGTNPTSTTHTCEGAVLKYRDSEVDGDRVLSTDRQFIILAGSIKPPAIPVKTFCRITVDGVAYQGIEVDSDPANATFTVQGR